MENRKVLVTGGNRGIGRGIAEEFLKNGNQVLATCRDVSKFPYKNDPFGQLINDNTWSQHHIKGCQY